MRAFPFFQEQHRAVRQDEAALVSELLEREAPHLLDQLSQLSIVGRCGCGVCPTIFLGQYDPGQDFSEVAVYAGADHAGAVGVTLFVTQQRISQLEIYSLDGHEPVRLPSITSLYRLEAGVSNPTFQRTATPPLN